MIETDSGGGKTLLSPEEEDDLIPSLGTRGELNAWERMNIVEAADWAMSARNLRLRDPLAEEYVRELHRRMFDQTWKWAGRYRSTEKNIGVEPHRIREMLGGLLGDVRYWMEFKTYGPDEIAVRLHHRMVWIHPFANGNGRHARLMADVMARRMGRAVFSWGAGLSLPVTALRRRYLEALKAADGNEIRNLIQFARS